jgi:hypothetical protein
MKKQIKSVSLVQNAKMVAVLYALMSLPFLAILYAVGGFVNQPGLSLVSGLFFVLIYVVSGFVFALIGGWICNLVASTVGGFEFTTAEVKSS